MKRPNKCVTHVNFIFSYYSINKQLVQHPNYSDAWTLTPSGHDFYFQPDWRILDEQSGTVFAESSSRPVKSNTNVPELLRVVLDDLWYHR